MFSARRPAPVKEADRRARRPSAVRSGLPRTPTCAFGRQHRCRPVDVAGGRVGRFTVTPAGKGRFPISSASAAPARWIGPGYVGPRSDPMAAGLADDEPIALIREAALRDRHGSRYGGGAALQEASVPALEPFWRRFARFGIPWVPLVERRAVPAALAAAGLRVFRGGAQALRPGRGPVGRVAAAGASRGGRRAGATARLRGSAAGAIA